MTNKDKNGLPEQFSDYFIPTLNQTGFMTTTLDVYSQQFVDEARNVDAPVLEIGAAYGVATIPALKNGATVIANDLDERHLQILKNRTPKEFHDRLILKPGKFPDELQIEDDSLSAVLICRILHFFDGDAIERSIKAVSRWLKPNGKIFIIADTPYLGNMQNLIPDYEARLNSGDKWPGYTTDIKSRVMPEFKDYLPNVMHFLDPTVLRRVLEENNFEIETLETFARHEYPPEIQLDGREGVAAIARKKS